jgi:hypothetical protein
MKSDPPPSRIFEEVSADLFSHGGHHFLAYADRLSGWTTVTVWRKDPTSHNLIKTIAREFVHLGVPIKLRSDGGTQFDSREFRSFLQRWGVSFVPSTPHNPQSNGLAESAVKSMKKLVIRTVPYGDLDHEVFLQAMVEWRNTPRHHGASPAEIVFGHPIRSLVPAHHHSFSSEWQQSMADWDKRAAIATDRAAQRYNERAHSLPPPPHWHTRSCRGHGHGLMGPDRNRRRHRRSPGLPDQETKRRGTMEEFPSHFITGKDWKCSQCGTWNFARRLLCCFCKTFRVAGAPRVPNLDPDWDMESESPAPPPCKIKLHNRL